MGLKDWIEKGIVNQTLDKVLVLRKWLWVLVIGGFLVSRVANASNNLKDQFGGVICCCCSASGK